MTKPNKTAKEKIEKITDANFIRYTKIEGGDYIDRSYTYYEKYIESKINEIIDKLNND
jgi:hypothetical protein